MTAWFTPTAENYFSRVSRDQILAAIRKAKRRSPCACMGETEKVELAQLAERELAAMNWLPELLR